MYRNAIAIISPMARTNSPGCTRFLPIVDQSRPENPMLHSINAAQRQAPRGISCCVPVVAEMHKWGSSRIMLSMRFAQMPCKADPVGVGWVGEESKEARGLEGYQPFQVTVLIARLNRGIDTSHQPAGAGYDGGTHGSGDRRGNGLDTLMPRRRRPFSTPQAQRRAVGKSRVSFH
jgi:hypothetical protein